MGRTRCVSLPRQPWAPMAWVTPLRSLVSGTKVQKLINRWIPGHLVWRDSIMAMGRWPRPNLGKFQIRIKEDYHMSQVRIKDPTMARSKGIRANRERLTRCRSSSTWTTSMTKSMCKIITIIERAKTECLLWADKAINLSRPQLDRDMSPRLVLRITSTTSSRWAILVTGRARATRWDIALMGSLLTQGREDKCITRLAHKFPLFNKALTW